MGPYDKEENALDKAGRATEFKRILLNKCQAEFQKENEIADALEEAAKLKEEVKALEAATPPDADKISETKTKDNSKSRKPESVS